MLLESGGGAESACTFEIIPKHCEIWDLQTPFFMEKWMVEKSAG